MKRKKKGEYLSRLTESLTDLEKTLGREPRKHFREEFLRPSFVKLNEILKELKKRGEIWEEEKERKRKRKFRAWSVVCLGL